MAAKQYDSSLIDRYSATRDPGLREEAILRYVPLVHFVLSRLGLSQGMGADYEDAASQGLLGLIEAVDKYNPAYGAQFSTYAILRIRGKVIDHLRAQDWLSRGARQRARQVQDGIAAFWEEFGRSPSDEELAARLKLDMPKLHRALLDGSRTLISLDSIVTGDGGDQDSLHELLPDEHGVEPYETFEEKELQIQLAGAIQALPSREQLILSLYYFEELTFKEIGAVLEVSESRACQLHGRAILTLRALLEGSKVETRPDRGVAYLWPEFQTLC